MRDPATGVLKGGGEEQILILLSYICITSFSLIVDFVFIN